jgi:hypothetical protein
MLSWTGRKTRTGQPMAAAGCGVLIIYKMSRIYVARMQSGKALPQRRVCRPANRAILIMMSL